MMTWLFPSFLFVLSVMRVNLFTNGFRRPCVIERFTVFIYCRLSRKEEIKGTWMNSPNCLISTRANSFIRGFKYWHSSNNAAHRYWTGTVASELRSVLRERTEFYLQRRRPSARRVGDAAIKTELGFCGEKQTDSSLRILQRSRLWACILSQRNHVHFKEWKSVCCWLRQL